MKSVFAVSSGSYSDYRVLAVFSTRRQAEGWVSFCEDSFVEEFALDPEEVPTPDLRCFRIRSAADKLTVDRVEVMRGMGMFGVEDIGSKVVVNVYARDVDHATKIAADRFREAKALRSMGV